MRHRVSFRKLSRTHEHRRALLRNLDQRLRAETGLPVMVAENPLTSVVLGAGRMLTDLPLLRKVSTD